MAKPVSVAEDEALKFYRLKNILTPPAIIELSELDREMSDILSRSDLSSQERAFRYKKALVKFQNIYKDYFPSEILKPQKENKKDEQQSTLPEAIPFRIPHLEFETEADIEKEDAENQKEQTQVVNTPNLIPRAKKLDSSLSKHQNLELRKTSGYVLVKDPKRKREVRKIPEGLWNKTLNYLALSAASNVPLWNGKKRKKITEFISQIILSNKIIGKNDIERYPNVAHVIENIEAKKRPKSLTPSFSPAKPISPTKTQEFTSSPTQSTSQSEYASLNNTKDFMSEDDGDEQEIDAKDYDEKFAGAGLHVKFNKWNKTVHG